MQISVSFFFHLSADGGVSVDEAMSRAEQIYLGDLMRTEDAHEGLGAFMEKRKPQWKDR